jgi:hypothetical protein
MRKEKLKFMPHAAAVTRDAPSLSAAAKALGVNVGTISRAVQRGDLPAPSAGQPPKRRTAGASASTADSFEAWATGEFEFARQELELVHLAQGALDLWRDANASPALRLAASKEYRACLKDLNLPVAEVEERYGVAEGPRSGRRRA